MEEGAEVIGGVDLAEFGGVAAEEVGVVLADVEILLLLLLGLPVVRYFFVVNKGGPLDIEKLAKNPCILSQLM